MMCAACSQLCYYTLLFHRRTFIKNDSKESCMVEHLSPRSSKLCGDSPVCRDDNVMVEKVRVMLHPLMAVVNRNFQTARARVSIYVSLY
jgi:hypothetical protein